MVCRSLCNEAIWALAGLVSAFGLLRLAIIGLTSALDRGAALTGL